MKTICQRRLAAFSHPGSSDVAQVLGRCNIDAQFLDLLPPTTLETLSQTEEPENPQWLRALGARAMTPFHLQVANCSAWKTSSEKTTEAKLRGRSNCGDSEKNAAESGARGKQMLLNLHSSS